MKSEIKKILVTGAKGFVGSNTAKHFKSLGYETYGLGRGDISTKELIEYGLDYWKNSEITIQAIKDYTDNFDVIVHCGGSGSVGFSVENPYLDFKKTVNGTLEVLEFMRLYSPKAHLIYPSSPAVQGEQPDFPMNESLLGEPASPYGYHKKIAEELCQSYSEKFGLKVSIVRLFSVYGVGLKKQLLWDAVKKISLADEEAVFWGTGQETRDFIHIHDVVKLFAALISQESIFLLTNGGTGKKISIAQVVKNIKTILDSGVKLTFNNKESAGNPIYYCASVERLENLIDFKIKGFEQGLVEYVRWASEQ